LREVGWEDWEEQGEEQGEEDQGEKQEWEGSQGFTVETTGWGGSYGRGRELNG
jgi:hypothetical protein